MDEAQRLLKVGGRLVSNCPVTMETGYYTILKSWKGRPFTYMKVTKRPSAVTVRLVHIIC